ncbi:MAG: HemK2/MTQ2 family protein methyltransferase [Candidatus Baldrarchaeia archaeon]
MDRGNQVPVIRISEPQKLPSLLKMPGIGTSATKRRLKQTFIRLLLNIYHRSMMRPRKVKILDKTFIVLPGTFSPVWTLTSRFLALNLDVREGEKVLDVGTGCGVQAIFAADVASEVVATDINPIACECARINALINGVFPKMDVRQGDLFEPVGGDEKFDLIIFSPPYLDGEPRDMLERSWMCGKGHDVIRRFFREARRYLREGGRVRMVYSTIADTDILLQILERYRWDWRVVARKKYPLEEIFVLEARPYEG